MRQGGASPKARGLARDGGCQLLGVSYGGCQLLLGKHMLYLAICQHHLVPTSCCAGEIWVARSALTGAVSLDSFPGCKPCGAVLWAA